MAKKSSRVRQRVLHGQRSWMIANDQVELAVTELGGHMAPVTFFRDSSRPVQPYYISPWQGKKMEVPAPVLAPLRGDFFCLPFGVNSEPFRGERHPPHGETSGGTWQLDGCTADDEALTLRLRFETQVRPGRVLRELSIRPGHNVVYSRTVIEGFAGPTPFSHHATLAVPGEERSLLLSCSPFRFGRTYPGLASNPEQGAYQSLAPDAAFRDLAKVPSIFRGEPTADCTAFPTRRGFADLLQVFEKPSPKRDVRSWVAAVNAREGWLWYALKDPRVMPGRLFWIENYGRHGPPWNGRNACLGVEDGCTYFDLGIAQSCHPNPVSRQGIATCVELSGGPSLEIRYIQGAARIPQGFGRVEEIRFEDQSIVFRTVDGHSITAPVAHEFLLAHP